jgi:hypothetical protein
MSHPWLPTDCQIHHITSSQITFSVSLTSGRPASAAAPCQIPRCFISVLLNIFRQVYLIGHLHACCVQMHTSTVELR